MDDFAFTRKTCRVTSRAAWTDCPQGMRIQGTWTSRKHRVDNSQQGGKLV